MAGSEPAGLAPGYTLLVTTITAGMLDVRPPPHPLRSALAGTGGARAAGTGARTGTRSSTSSSRWPAPEEFPENRALADFAATRMFYQLLSLVAVREGQPVGLYTNETTRFAWAFDPSRCCTLVGGVNNMCTGTHRDRSAGAADGYMTSLLTADESSAEQVAAASGGGPAMESTQAADGAAAQLAALQAQLAALQAAAAVGTHDAADSGTERDEEEEAGAGAGEAEEAAPYNRGVYAYLDQQTALMPNLLNAQGLPFEVLLAPPGSCPAPFGEWPPPPRWWERPAGGGGGGGSGEARAPRTIFERAQAQYEAADPSSAIATYPNMVAVEDGKTLLARLFDQQSAWSRRVAAAGGGGNTMRGGGFATASSSGGGGGGGGLVRTESTALAAQEEAERMFFSCGQHTDHNEVLACPLSLAALVGIVLLGDAAAEPAEAKVDRADARRWAEQYLRLVAAEQATGRGGAAVAAEQATGRAGAAVAGGAVRAGATTTATTSPSLWIGRIDGPGGALVVEEELFARPDCESQDAGGAVPVVSGFGGLGTADGLPFTRTGRRSFAAKTSLM
eukprot:SAG22_NODE_154_length_17189_cov_38.210064_6_plen_563_part_00